VSTAQEARVGLNLIQQLNAMKTLKWQSIKNTSVLYLKLNASNIFYKTRKNEVVADQGIIVSNHPLASSAGIEMFALGGNAFDASVASLFTLTVVSPSMVGIFGAGFFVLRDAKTGKIETVNNHAVSPIATTEDMFTPIEDVHPPPMYLISVGRKNYTGHLRAHARC